MTLITAHSQHNHISLSWHGFLYLVGASLSGPLVGEPFPDLLLSDVPKHGQGLDDLVAGVGVVKVA